MARYAIYNRGELFILFQVLFPGKIYKINKCRKKIYNNSKLTQCFEKICYRYVKKYTVGNLKS